VKFAVVVVTFNRKVMLGECLQALLRQTRVPDHIYLVDNASSDGTPQYLRDAGLMDHPKISYQRLEKNTGGAGGFHAGLKTAFEAGNDWIWIMDDDAEPLPDALEKLLPYTEYPQVVGIASLKKDLNGADLVDVKPVVGVAAPPQFPYQRLQFSSFVGVAFSHAAMTKIGLPRAEFFLHHDDTEYCLRLLATGDIAYAPESVVIHKEARGADRFKKRFGRQFRVFPTDRYCMGYFGRRNGMWMDIHTGLRRPGRRSLAVHLVQTGKHLLRATLIDREDLWVRYTICVRSFLDALRGHFDNDLPFRLRARLSKATR